MGIFDRFKNREKSGAALTKEDLINMSNVELRDVIADRMMKEAGRREVKQCLQLFDGAKRVFYVVSLYEAEVSTDGLCRFLVGPGHSSAAYILPALTAIHASRHADLLKQFTARNGIDLTDLSALEISNSWEYDERKKLYPFETFNEKFEKLYEKESIEARLMAYVRNHIDEFVE